MLLTTFTALKLDGVKSRVHCLRGNNTEAPTSLKASVDNEGFSTEMEERYYLIISIVSLESWGFWIGPWCKNRYLLIQNISQTLDVFAGSACICMYASKEVGIDITGIPFSNVSEPGDWIKKKT